MSNQPRPGASRAETLLFIMVIVWAINYSVSKYALSGLNPFVFNSIRFVVASVIIGIILLIRGQAWQRVTRADIPRLVNAGVVANVIYQIAFVFGLSMTSAGNSAVLFSTSPLWTTLLHARMHREKISRSMWTGMFLSLAGIIMLIIGSGKKMEFGGQEMIGDMICVAAAILWALNTNMQKPLLAHYSANQLAFMMVGVGAVGLTIVASPAIVVTHWTTVPWSVYAATIGSGIFSIGIANVVWSYGVQRLGPARTANFSNLVPVVAFGLSYVLLHDTILPIQVVGAIVTTLGVWVVRH